MRKFTILLCMFILTALPALAYTTPDWEIPVDITVNDNMIKTDAPAFLAHDTTFVPIRFVSDALGASRVDWNPKNATATIQKGNKTITITENKKDAYVNGQKVTLQQSARISGGRLFVPVRFISEGLGASVSWDNYYYTVKIYQKGITVNSSLLDRRYTTDEIFWLGRIIHAESEGEPARGKVAVGNVILNRVKSKDFPNTIYTVIFDREHGVQFEPILNGSIYNTPSKESIISAKRALRGESMVGNSLYFLNAKTATNSWISKNRPYYTTIYNHDFYL